MEKSEINLSEVAERYYGRLNPNSVLGAILVLVAGIFLFYIVPTYINEPPSMQHPLLSPRFLPQLAGWLVLLLSLALLIEGLVRPPKHTVAEQLHKGIPVLRWVLMIASGAIYMLFFEELGAIGSGILVSVLLFLASDLRKVSIYLLAIVFPVVVSLLFVHLLNVPLPVGTLWE